MEHLHQMAMNCKQAARELALYDTETKNRALLAVAQALEDNMDSILCANARDAVKGHVAEDAARRAFAALCSHQELLRVLALSGEDFEQP